jgi:DNA-binding NarL/FixJ family response regulator
LPTHRIANQMELKRIRVFLAGMPPLLHDIVRDTLTNQPDMQLVGDLSAGNTVAHALKNGDIDVMIVGARQPDDSAVATGLLQCSARSKVLVVAISGRKAVMYQLRPHKRSLGDVSPQTLLEAIRRDL